MATDETQPIAIPCSLRDWFAGQAISSVIQQCVGDPARSINGRTPEEYFAEKAFAVADAMLAAREAAR